MALNQAFFMQPVINRVSRLFYNRSIGLLLLRIGAGVIFLTHGWAKLGDMSATITLFDTFGFSPLIAVLIAWLEIIGGLALIFGIAPRIMAGLLAFEMFVAALLVSVAGPADLEFLLMMACLGIVFIGSGRYALYKMECNTCYGLFCIKKNRVCVMPA